MSKLSSIKNIIQKTLPAYIHPRFFENGTFFKSRPTVEAVSDEVMTGSARGFIYNVGVPDIDGYQYETDVIEIPSTMFTLHNLDWFYDWSYLTNNDGRLEFEVRQYPSASIPSTVPYLLYDGGSSELLPSGSVVGHWIFSNPLIHRIDDITGNGNNFSGSSWESTYTVFDKSRQPHRPATRFYTGSTYIIPTGSGSGIDFSGSFSWEWWIKGLDTNFHASSIALGCFSGSAGVDASGWNFYFIPIDGSPAGITFKVYSGSAIGAVTGSISDLQTEEIENYHYFAGTHLAETGLFLYVDGQLLSSAEYTGSLKSSDKKLSLAVTLGTGKTLSMDELAISNCFYTAQDIQERYRLGRERLISTRIFQSEMRSFHQSRITFFANNPKEVEFDQFSICGVER